MILNLPEDVFLNLLLTWCSLRTITNFDAAVCKHVDRAVLLNLFASKLFVLRIDIWSYNWKSRNFVKWIIMRRIQMDTIHLLFLEHGDEDLVNIICAVNLTSIETINITVLSEFDVETVTIGKLVNLCPNVAKLDLGLCINKLHRPLCAFIDDIILKQLLEVRLTGTNSFDRNTLDRFSKLCSWLIKFDVDFDKFTDVRLIDIHNVVQRCKHLTLFATNYPVNEVLLSIIPMHLTFITDVQFDCNITFSFDAVAKFLKSVTGSRLRHFQFQLDAGILSYSEEIPAGIASVSYVSRLLGSVKLGHSDLNMNFVALLTSQCVNCPSLHLFSLPVTRAFLINTLATLNQVSSLHFYGSAFDSDTLSSFGILFTQCKNLIGLEMAESGTLLYAEDLQAVFAQKTRLQFVSLELGVATLIDAENDACRNALMHVVNGCPELTRLYVIAKDKAFLTAFQTYLLDINRSVLIETR
jgi:hypothetical protein